MPRPVFAADTTFLRLREAAILAEAKSIEGLNVEVVCGNWRVLVRGAIGAEKRHWYTLEVEWDDIQTEDDNPLLDAVLKVGERLREAIAPKKRPRRAVSRETIFQKLDDKERDL